MTPLIVSDCHLTHTYGQIFPLHEINKICMQHLQHVKTTILLSMRYTNKPPSPSLLLPSPPPSPKHLICDTTMYMYKWCHQS